jgi:hypothetical protein
MKPAELATTALILGTLGLACAVPAPSPDEETGSTEEAISRRSRKGDAPSGKEAPSPSSEGSPGSSGTTTSGPSGEPSSDPPKTPSVGSVNVCTKLEDCCTRVIDERERLGCRLTAAGGDTRTCESRLWLCE